MRVKSMCYILILLVAVCLTGVSGRAQVIDDEGLSQIKRDSRVFENIIGEVLRESFDNPFAIAAEPRAAFLQGYGLNVTFHLKINRGTIRGPWGEINNPWTKQSQSKEEQVKGIKESMIQALADYGNTVKHLDPSHRITVCAHIEDLNELDKSKSRTVLILSVRKRDIVQYVTSRMNLEKFKKSVQVLEY
jgi:hypothetical protein